MKSSAATGAVGAAAPRRREHGDDLEQARHEHDGTRRSALAARHRSRRPERRLRACSAGPSGFELGDSVERSSPSAPSWPGTAWLVCRGRSESPLSLACGSARACTALGTGAPRPGVGSKGTQPMPVEIDLGPGVGVLTADEVHAVAGSCSPGVKPTATRAGMPTERAPSPRTCRRTARSSRAGSSKRNCVDGRCRCGPAARRGRTRSCRGSSPAARKRFVVDGCGAADDLLRFGGDRRAEVGRQLEIRGRCHPGRQRGRCPELRRDREGQRRVHCVDDAVESGTFVSTIKVADSGRSEHRWRLRPGCGAYAAGSQMASSAVIVNVCPTASADGIESTARWGARPSALSYEPSTPDLRRRTGRAPSAASTTVARCAR